MSCPAALSKELAALDSFVGIVVQRLFASGTFMRDLYIGGINHDRVS